MAPRSRRTSLPLAATLLLLALSHAQQSILGPLRQPATDTLTLHMYYCSSCYANAAREAYCHRLALAKYFRAVCQADARPACVATSQATIATSFQSLVAPAAPGLPPPPPPSSPSQRDRSLFEDRLNGGGDDDANELSRQQAALDGAAQPPPLKPGVFDSLQCAAFDSAFITTGPGALEDKEDAQIAADQLAVQLVALLNLAFRDLDPEIVDESSVKPVVIFTKPRPPGSVDPGPQTFPVGRNDPIRLLAPSSSSSSLSSSFASAMGNDTSALQRALVMQTEDQREATLAEAGITGLNPHHGMAPSWLFTQCETSRRPDVARTATVDPVGGTRRRVHDDAGDRTAGGRGGVVRMQLPTVVRMAGGGRRPRSARIPVVFKRRVNDGLVRLAFRRLMRTDRVLKTFQKGSHVVQRKPKGFRYEFVVYYTKNYQRVYNSVRRFSRRF